MRLWGGVYVQITDRSSAPSGTNTPSESRYSRKSADRGRMTVDLILFWQNVGYQLENWKARIAEGVYIGKRGGMETGAGMGYGLDGDEGGSGELTNDK